MDEHQRLLALLEVYDTAIEELYVLGDRGLVDLILRLERRRQDADRRLAALDGASTSVPRVDVTSTIDEPYVLGEAS